VALLFIFHQSMNECWGFFFSYTKIINKSLRQNKTIDKRNVQTRMGTFNRHLDFFYTVQTVDYIP